MRLPATVFAMGTVFATVLPAAFPAAAGALRDAPLRDAYARPPFEWPAATFDPGVAFVELGPAVPPPPGNAAAVRAGERLFHDPRLSRSGTTACVTCHDPARGWADGRALPVGDGGRAGRRNSPSLLGAGTRASWRWDGRHATLAEAVLAPLLDPAEMGNPDLASVLRRLGGVVDGDVDGDGADGESLVGALAAFVATVDGPTRFDRFAAGDATALSDEEIRGLHLFRTKARCANCHFGPHLTDNGFHNLRLSSFGEASADLGRHGATGDPDDAGRFRTPGLRHVGRTAPYMHNGLFPTLEGVVNLYARGGGEVRANNQEEADRPLFHEAARLDPLIRPLDLDAAEKAALVAFLRTL